MLARPDDGLHPLLGPGERTTRERRREPGPHDGGLAAARRPDDPEQRRSRQARHELGNDLLPPEERVGIGDVEARQALVRTRLLCGRSVRLDSAESPLEVDDAAGEVGLGGAQLLAADGGAQRGLLETAARLGAQPFGDDLVDAQGNASGLLEHCVERQPDGRIARDRPDELGEPVGVEWLELSVRRTGKRRARGGEHECRRACDSVAGMAHGVEELLVRGVQIVEDEQDGRRDRAGLGQRRSGRVAASDAAHVPHLAALHANLPRQLGREAGLTHAPRPGDHGHLPRLVRRPFPCFA